MCCAQKSFSSGAACDESIFGLIFSLPRHRARSRSYEKYTKGEEEKLLSFDNVFDEIEHDIRSAIKDLYEGDGTDPGVRRWPRTTPRCCGTLRRAAAARAELPPPRAAGAAGQAGALPRGGGDNQPNHKATKSGAAAQNPGPAEGGEEAEGAPEGPSLPAPPRRPAAAAAPGRLRLSPRAAPAARSPKLASVAYAA